MPRYDRHTHPGMKRRWAEAKRLRRERIAERHAAGDHGGCGTKTCFEAKNERYRRQENAR